MLLLASNRQQISMTYNKLFTSSYLRLALDFSEIGITKYKIPDPERKIYQK